tara:strand:+ start:573 stop:791 length:219 start_codon:yes stop_codon:yes gene_type:complete
MARTYAGYPINWALQDGSLVIHPLYVKYNSSTFGDIDAAAVKTDLNGCLATADGAAIVAYLAWLLRTKALVA